MITTISYKFLSEFVPGFLLPRGLGGWIIVVVLLLAMLYWYGMSDYSIVRDLPYPGPRPWPFIGNFLDVDRYGGMQHMLVAYFKKYGRIHKMFIGRRSTLVIGDPEIVKQILVKEFDKFADRPKFIETRPPTSLGLFVINGSSWKRIRTTLVPSFTALKMKEVVPVMDKAAGTLKEKIAKFVVKGESVDAVELFGVFALDVILKAGFGKEIDVQNNTDSEFVKKSKDFFKPPVWSRFVTMIPFWKHLGQWFEVLPNENFWAEQAKIMLERRRSQEGNGQKDLLQLMLDAQAEQGLQRISDEEIIAQTFSFLLAGYETTGSALSNLAFFLINNPDVQDKLMEELDKARAEHGDMPLYSFIRRLPYMDQVVSEVLRVCPPSFNLFRLCCQECTIKGVRFPKGVDVIIPLYSIHRDPEIWGENAEKFDPEHFSPEAKSKRHPYAFLPFGMGPRNCIGMRFALMEISIGLLRVLENFRFERAPETRPTNEQEAVITMAPKYPVYVKFSRR